MKGFYLINKPTGITSHDVIYRLRKITGEKRIGHAGTLDPSAAGLLIVAVGREYTKRISEFSGLDKEYIAEIELGKVSDTYDAEGEVTFVTDRAIMRSDVDKILKKFRGVYEQIPPAYSAKKIKGKKAYELARAGKKVELKPVPVQIKDLEVLGYSYPMLKIKTMVSAGTYIRSLAHDIGQALGTGAYLKSLVRTKIGDYDVSSAIEIKPELSLDDLSKAKI